MNCEQAQDLLDQYAAGTLTVALERQLKDHLAGCAACRAEAEGVQPLLSEAARLPRSIEPPADLWPSISARINQRKSVDFRPLRPWWARPSLLAAAAVALVVLSSAVTTFIIRGRPAPPETMGSGAVSLSQDFLTLEAEYSSAADEIVVALQQGDVKISPRTRDILQRNLRIIDDAINESRAALARDPANQELKDMLLTAYQHKLDLLRRVTSPSAL